MEQCDLCGRMLDRFSMCPSCDYCPKHGMLLEWCDSRGVCLICLDEADTDEPSADQLMAQAAWADRFGQTR